MSEVQCTIVFEKTMDAINALDENGKRKYRYIVHEGSSRSSKTQSLIQTIHNKCLTTPNLRASVWRDTKTDCVATVGYDVSKIFKQLPNYHIIKENKTKHHYEFPNDTIFELNGSDDEDKVIGYQGSISWFNEPYKISRETFNQIDMRTSDFVIIDWNPKKKHWVDDLKKDPRCLVIHSTFKDNPFCPEEQRNKILGYQPVSMCDAVISKTLSEDEAFHYNAQTNDKGLTDKQISELLRCRLNEDKNSASLFNWKVYGLGLKAENPSRIFNHFKPISYQEYKELNTEKYYAVDWGQVDPFAILECKYYDGAIYFHELNYASEHEIKTKLSSDILSQIMNEDEGLVKYLFSKLDVNKDSYVICDNNRPAKVLMLREIGYEMALTASKLKGSIKDGIDLLNNINVYYTKESVNFADESDNYKYKVDRYGIITDEPEDADNHLMDCSRYISTFLRNQSILKNI